MSESDLKLMRCMDELHMQYPFAGSRMMRDLLNRQGHHIGRRQRWIRKFEQLKA